MSIKIKNSRRFAVRAILIALYLALLVLMLFTGRRHTILIDNKAAPDGSYAAVDGMSVRIDALEASEYYPGDRDKALVKGQKHRIQIETFADGKIEEREFRLAFGQDIVLLSVPKLLAGIEPYIETFTMQEEHAPSSDAAAPQSIHFGGEGEAPAVVSP